MPKKQLYKIQRTFPCNVCGHLTNLIYGDAYITNSGSGATGYSVCVEHKPKFKFIHKPRKVDK